MEKQNNLSRRDFLKTLAVGVVLGFTQDIPVFGQESDLPEPTPGPTRRVSPSREESSTQVAEARAQNVESDIYTSVEQTGSIPVEQVLVPAGFVFQGERLPVRVVQPGEIAYDAIYGSGRRYITEALKVMGFTDLEIEEHLATDARLIADQSSLVDAYLNQARGGSWGTTFVTLTQGGEPVLICGYHSSNFEGQTQTYYDTVIEETVQALQYKRLFQMLREFPDFFIRPEIQINTAQDMMQSLTTGNLRAYTELLQHLALFASSRGWAYVSYGLKIQDNPQTRNFGELRTQFIELVTGINPDIPSSLEETLSLYADKQNFMQLNERSMMMYGRPIWDLVGMFRNGLTIPVRQLNQ